MPKQNLLLLLSHRQSSKWKQNLSFSAGPCISTLICKALQGATVTFQMAQNREELRKISHKAFGHVQTIGDGPACPSDVTEYRRYA